MSSISELKQEIGFRKYTEWKRDRITNDEICNLVKNFSRITCLLNCCMWKCQTNIVAIQRIRNSAAYFPASFKERSWKGREGHLRVMRIVGGRHTW